MRKFETPSIEKAAFTCPHCGVLAQMHWKRLTQVCTSNVIYDIYIAICEVCKNHNLWQKYYFSQNNKPYIKEEMIYPKIISTIPPVDDMPEEIKEIYKEASNVLGDSPRAACALLRLALQELMKYLKNNYEKYKNLKGENINEDIGELVKSGLSPKVQQALDIVRITGNDAVHSIGVLDTNDNLQIANKLFEMLNLIVKEMITIPNEINKIFNDNIPEKAKEAIKKRDESK